MAELDPYRIRECAMLGARAAVEDNPHYAYAYFRWLQHHAEEVLYEDLWRATEPRSSNE